jgi:hypothetical protein
MPDYYHTGAVQSVALAAGTHTIQCWGADGGATLAANNSHRGRGGYVRANLTLTASTTIYIHVGETLFNEVTGQSDARSVNGWLYGGGAFGYGTATSYYSGGGATFITTGSGAWNSTTARSGMLMLAGGGGSGRGANYYGGHGGGMPSESGSFTGDWTSGPHRPSPGLQTSAGLDGINLANSTNTLNAAQWVAMTRTNTSAPSGQGYASGGGGGWFAGGSGRVAGAGGSNRFATDSRLSGQTSQTYAFFVFPSTASNQTPSAIYVNPAFVANPLMGTARGTANRRTGNGSYFGLVRITLNTTTPSGGNDITQTPTPPTTWPTRPPGNIGADQEPQQTSNFLFGGTRLTSVRFGATSLTRITYNGTVVFTSG